MVESAAMVGLRFVKKRGKSGTLSVRQTGAI